jgi:integrase
MKQVLAMSATDYARTQKLSELDETMRQSLPVSSYRLSDGSHQVISEYGDDVWRIEDTRFPSNTTNFKKIIRFTTIPAQFIASVKYALMNYDIKNTLAGKSLVEQFKNIRSFLIYLDKIGIKHSSDINPLLCANYVKDCKELISKQTKKPLGKSTLTHRFLAVESYWFNLQGTDWAFDKPWIDSSASFLAGNCSQGKRIAKTRVIPDNQLQRLISYCNDIMQKAPALIELKTKIDAKRELLIDRSQSYRDRTITNELLKPNGYSNLTEFNNLYSDIPTAMAIIILTFSGVRIHELCAIQSDAYRIQDEEDGNIYYYLKSHSSKTHEGYAEWMIPEIAIEAINVQKAYIKPLRISLLQEQSDLLVDDANDHRGLAINHYKDHLFLTNSQREGNKVNSMTGVSFGERLKAIEDKLGLERFSSHCFRRTFAVYVAQSAYGDLRYLKEHFKHWSMDMTLLYASNENQQAELYEEVAKEVKNRKLNIVENILEEDTVIAGGLADSIISYRSKNESIQLFNSRAEMAEKLSDTIHIRSTGHSWCTSDRSACGGQSVIEATRCVNCKDSIIEKKRHAEFFKGMYLQQLELRQIDDIGPAGQQRVERDIEHCEQVLNKFNMFGIAQEEAKKLGLVYE